MPRPLVDFFEWFAPLYRRLAHPPDPGPLLEQLQLAPGHRLLDVGGGTGRVAEALRATGAAICIVDVSQGMLRQAQATGAPYTCQGRAEGLPYAAASFDRVLAVDSFHHFWDHARAARELLRVVKPGGRIVIEEPDVRRFSVKLIALAERMALMRSVFFPPEELAALFATVGGTMALHEGPGPLYHAVIERAR